jgi:hypothetical protein
MSAPEHYFCTASPHAKWGSSHALAKSPVKQHFCLLCTTPHCPHPIFPPCFTPDAFLQSAKSFIFCSFKSDLSTECTATQSNHTTVSADDANGTAPDKHKQDACLSGTICTAVTPMLSVLFLLAHGEGGFVNFHSCVAELCMRDLRGKDTVNLNASGCCMKCCLSMIWHE